MKYIFFIGLICFYNFHIYTMIAHNIAYRNSISTIKLILCLNNDINEPYKGHLSAYLNFTPLQVACEEENLEMVSFLLFFPQIRVNDYKEYTNPVLHTMIKKCNNNRNTRDITRLLIGYPSININLGDINKKTPLHIAAQWNNKEAVSDILDIHHTNVNPNLQDRNGNTPLHIACYYNHQKIVKKLLTNPTINLEIKNNKGATPFAIACFKGFIDSAQLLIQKGCNINSQDNNLDTSLHYACNNNNASLLSLLIQHKADVTLENQDHKPPIFVACIKNNDTCVDILLKTCPELIKTTYNQQSLLYTAAKHKRTNIIRVLIEKKPAIYCANENNETALHQSCINNSFDDVLALLSADNSGINIQRNFLKQTALHIATAHANPIIVALLLAYGADSTILDENQETPLACCYFQNKAHRMNSTDLQSMIQAIDKKGNTQLHLYATSNLSQYNSQKTLNEKTIDNYLSFLLVNGVSIWSRNQNGQTGTDIAVQDYIKTYNFYLQKPIPSMKCVLDTQEYIMHAFLRVTSQNINAILFKKCFELYQLLPDITQHIMRYYYKINVETIIASIYNNNRRYYDQSMDQKKDIKKQLMKKPENPDFLWGS